MKNLLVFFILISAFFPSLLKAQEPYWEYSGLQDKRLLSLIAHPDGTVFAGTLSGIYASRDHGKSWQLSGAPKSGIISFAVNNQGHVFAGAFNSEKEKGGLWRSLDTGQTWTQHVKGISSENGSPHTIQSIACKDDGTMFISNFYISHDNGESWEAKWSKGAENTDEKIIIGLNNELIGIGFHTIVRSYDNGGVWEDLNPYKVDTVENFIPRFMSLAVSPKGYLYAGSAYGGLIRSKDDGATWRQLKDKFILFGGMDSLEFVNDIVFAKDGAMYAIAGGRGIFRSNNDGDTWQNFWSGIVPQDSLEAMDFEAMCQDSAGYLYATATGKGIYRTSKPVIEKNSQLNEDCLCTPQVSVNEDSIAIDTCGYTRILPGESCESLWEMSELEAIFNQRRAYTKIGWNVQFRVDAIVLPAVPHDSVVEVSWKKIDSSFVTLRELFRKIEEKYGKFVLRKSDPEFSTGELSWHYRLIFEKYVNLIEFREETSDLEDISFNFTMPAWILESVDNENPESLLLIHPNPASENITITFPQNQSFKTAKLILRDIAGREMFLKESDDFKNTYTISLKEFPVGIYILEVHSGGEVFTKQVSVIR